MQFSENTAMANRHWQMSLKQNKLPHRYCETYVICNIKSTFMFSIVLNITMRLCDVLLAVSVILQSLVNLMPIDTFIRWYTIL